MILKNNLEGRRCEAEVPAHTPREAAVLPYFVLPLSGAAFPGADTVDPAGGTSYHQ